MTESSTSHHESDQDVDLGDFHAMVTLKLRNFCAHWLQKRREDPEGHPVTMHHTDWWRNFDTFCEMEDD